jgi:pyridoxine/pyridoxamine 5'-phosphate oxidase
VPDFAQPLREHDVDPDPIAQFAAWFADAGEAMRAPEAVAGATATPDVGQDGAAQTFWS